MSDPRNRADLPASWLPEATQVPPMPTEKAQWVARRIGENRRLKVLALANVVEDVCRARAISADALDRLTGQEWKDLAKQAGVKVPSAETRAAVVDKVRRDLAEPYRAKGRG